MQKIGIYIERQRAWGRLLCEGVADFAQAHEDWSLVMIEPEDFKSPALLTGFDGFIARIHTPRIAQALAQTGRLVADLSCEQQHLSRDFLRGVVQDNTRIAQMAARHFIEHHFSRFAFCGYDGKRFSDARRDAFVRCLQLNRFACTCYHTPPSAVREFDNAISHRERLTPGADAPQLAAWLKRLPKPVAIFCANDLRGYQVVHACAAVGLKVPHDVAVLGVDNDTLVCNFTTPRLSSIDPDAFELGRAAAECLAAKFERPDLDILPRKIRPKALVTRASTQVYPLDPPWLSDALVYIHSNIIHHLSASEVCRHIHLSHTCVNAVFRAKLGSTVQMEIRRAQLAEAKRLLQTSTLTISEIARQTGFGSIQYFSNVYSSAFGVAPSRARPKSVTG